MAERRKIMNQGENRSSGLWMVTFSDLVMLLLTFFVLLLSMSSLDTKRLKSLFTHFRQATGILEFSDLRSVPDFARFIASYNSSDGIVVIDQGRLSDMLIPFRRTDKELDKRFREIRDEIRITDDERGIVVTFPERILFEPGQIQVRRDFFPVLDSIARVIKSCPNNILIIGHTDNLPTKGLTYESNWELSSYRALSVLDYLIKVKGLPPLRFSVGAAGSSRPLYPNDTPETRALNRRVEIIFRHV